MKPKHSAAALKRLALDGALAGCEARAFAAYHAATLDAANHADFVEAFVLQLGRPEQHAAVLALLAGVERGFRGGKIAYARELQEPAAKPGESAFGIMRAVVPLLQRVDTTAVTDKWTAPRRPAGAAEGGAARVVRAFYDLINRKRVAEAMEYFAEVRSQPATDG